MKWAAIFDDFVLEHLKHKLKTLSYHLRAIKLWCFEQKFEKDFLNYQQKNFLLVTIMAVIFASE